jgi:hypothetical protein
MFSRTRGIAALALAFTLPVAACDEGTDPNFGSVSIQLTDAPGDSVVEAWVTITDIYLQQDADDADPASSRVYLLEDGEETHELISLADEVANLVVDKEVPTGVYGQLRVVMSAGCIENDLGEVFASTESYDLCGPVTGGLNMPSMDQTGAKVLLHGLNVDGGQQILLLDFNVEDSYGRVAAQSNTWVMHPVIHGAEIEMTAAVTATLAAGDVTLPDGFALDQFGATLEPAGTDPSEADFADDDGDGVYEVTFDLLVPDTGPFELDLVVPEGLDVTVNPGTPASVSPSSGGTAIVEWVLQSAVSDGA